MCLPVPVHARLCACVRVCVSEQFMPVHVRGRVRVRVHCAGMHACLPASLRSRAYVRPHACSRLCSCVNAQISIAKSASKDADRKIARAKELSNQTNVRV